MAGELSPAGSATDHFNVAFCGPVPTRYAGALRTSAAHRPRRVLLETLGVPAHVTERDVRVGVGRGRVTE